MAELNEYECGMLDALLEAFGAAGSLTRTQVMELFDGDEAAAYAMVRLLARNDLVAEDGQHGDYELPEKLVLRPTAGAFLKEGGFSSRYLATPKNPVETGGGTLAKLQQQNMRLQTEKLAGETQVRNLQKQVSSLEYRQYFWWALIVIALIAGYFIGHALGVHHAVKA